MDVKIDFNRFYRYEELTATLHALVEHHPQLLALQSIGQSHEGRDIWLVTVTNRGTGLDTEKPAFWVDANIHATELAGSVAALYLLDTLVRGYGNDADITRLLDTRSLYVCPRINPDGAEWAMLPSPKLIRSSTRPYPYAEDPVSGLVREDLDGDGRVLTMRIPDPNGPWKKHPTEPRLMVRRDPIETGGEYYRVLPEGRIENYDGVEIPVAPITQGLDLNRNFPAGWRQEHEQLGAGPYPTSEPEVRAVVDFLAHHPNVCGGLAFHTWSGVLLRPFDDRPDEEMAPEDLWTYQTIGDKGSELTGYPAISVYHEFRYHPKSVITGSFDWLFSHQGAFTWVVEIWSPMREAGITNYKYIDWFRTHPVEDDLKLLKWSDEKLEGKGYVDWYPYDHPQLGRIELGGWNGFYAFSNPAPQFLEKEVARFPKWIIWQALISPRLELVHAKAEAVSPGLWRVELVVNNTGWLPSYVSKAALERKITRGVIGEVTLPEGCTLAAGQVRNEGPQLEGRAYLHTLVSFWPPSHGTPDRAKFEWFVRGEAGAMVELTARHERAGTVRTQVKLD